MTPLPKHRRTLVSVGDTLRFFMFTTETDHYFKCFRRRPFQESPISPIVNMCLCCGNANFRTRNLLLRSSTVGNVKLRFGNLTDFSVFLLPLLHKYVQKLGYSFAVTKFSSWNFSLFLYEINLRVRQIYTTIKLKSICVTFIPFPAQRLVSNNAYLWSYVIR